MLWDRPNDCDANEKVCLITAPHVLAESPARRQDGVVPTYPMCPSRSVAESSPLSESTHRWKSSLSLDAMAATVSEANASALSRMGRAEPILVGAERAADALKLGGGELGHAGPPFADTASIPPPVLNAMAGAVVHEGWAGTMDEARASVLDGRIRLRSIHEDNASSALRRPSPSNRSATLA